MKTPKKISYLTFLLTGLILFGLQTCKKYANDKGLSLESGSELVSNVWKVDNCKINDVDLTSLYAGYSETFSKEGAYSYRYGILNGSGTWAFQNNDNEIQITGTNNQTSKTLIILKLEEMQFWYYYMDGNDKKEFHLVQQ